MNWVKLAVDLAREAMSPAPPPQPEPQQQTADPGAALAQQFAAIDRNIDAIVSSVNAQNARLERELRRQRTWNYALVAGIVVAAAIALWR
jgi:hypothetical protein